MGRKLNGKLNMGRIGRMIAAFLVMTMTFGVCAPVMSSLTGAGEADAAASRGKLLRLATAKAVAIANSEKIEALDMQIAAKQAAKESAIKSLSEKQRNMSTFRWSPLLNFKFPTDPNEAEAFEFAYKPTQIQYDIDTLKHKIEAEKLAVSEKVSGIYIDIITSIAECTFLEQRIDSLQKAILKNKARLAEGTASQAQIDQQQKKLDGYKSELSSEENKLQRAKEKLGTELGFNVTQGYTFEDAFLSTRISRSNIEYLQNYAIERDQTVFEAKQNLELARLTLMTNYSLMKSQYGNDINMISGYVTQSLDGSKVNRRSFKTDYDKFLKKIDQPWQGKYKILFFSFPKEWFKGDIDGIRYVEDDPYVLYSATLDYESALKDYNNTCNEIRAAVEDGYDNLMETRKSYKIAVSELNSLRRQLIYDEALNALGQLSIEEYDTELAEYEKARSSVKETLSLYTHTLYEFDRTTCGGASAYFAEELISTNTGYAGLASSGNDAYGMDAVSLMSPIIRKGATYSIRSIIDSEEFMLYIDIPEDFEYTVTHFELYSDGKKIGNKTPKLQAIRHLRLTLDDVDSVYIRLYNEDEIIDDCSIDPDVNYGPLNITVGYEMPDAQSDKKVGTYTVEDNSATDMIKLRFEFDQKGVEKNFNTTEAVKFFNLSAEKNLYLFSNDLVSVDDAFSYMSFIKSDLDQLTVRMFSEDGEYIGGAYFNMDDQSLYADTEITLSDMQEIAARQIVIERKASELKVELAKLEELLNVANDVNSQETDSATQSYYKKRIAEIEADLDDIGSLVTTEEVDAVLKNEKVLVEQKVQEFSSKNAPKTDEQQQLADDDISARNAVIKEAAAVFILEQKKQEELDSLQKESFDIKTKLAELKIRLDSVRTSRNASNRKERTDEIRKQIADLELEQKSVNNKISNLEAAEITSLQIRGVTDEEIESALLKNGDAIYAKAQDKLSNAMLYGSEAGQWATAYLESAGLEVNEENLRNVVSRADRVSDYEKAVARTESLKEEAALAREKAEKLRKEGGVTNLSLARQLEEIASAYDKEIKLNQKEIEKNDPGIIVKLKTKIADLEKKAGEKQKEKDELLTAGFTFSDYIKPYLEAISLAQAKGAKASSDWQAYKDKYEQTLATFDYEPGEIMYQINYLERDIRGYEVTIRELKALLNTPMSQAGYDRVESKIFYIQSYIDEYRDQIKELQAVLAEMEKAGIAYLDEDEIAEKKRQFLLANSDEYQRLYEKYISDKKQAQEEYEAALSRKNSATLLWEKDVAKDEALSKEIAGINREINSLNKLILEYE